MDGAAQVPLPGSIHGGSLQEQRMVEFVNWMNHNDFAIHSDISLFRHPDARGFSVRAESNLEEGAVLFQVPRKVILTLESSKCTIDGFFTPFIVSPALLRQVKALLSNLDYEELNDDFDGWDRSLLVSFPLFLYQAYSCIDV